jgi:hypothetical protein
MCSEVLMKIHCNMGTYFKGIQERNIPTVRCKIMEAVNWVFPNPAKLHCSPRVPFQRVLAMVEDEKPLFCTLSLFLFSLSLQPNDVRVEWPSSRQSTTREKWSVNREIVSFFVWCKIKPAGFYCIPTCVSFARARVFVYAYIYVYMTDLYQIEFYD